MRIIFGHIGVIFLIVIAILRDGRLLYFIDFPSVMIVFGVTFGLMLAAHPTSSLRELPYAFGRIEILKDKKGVLNILRSTQDYAISAAFLAVLIALIIMYSHVDVPGPAMSLGLLSSVYGLGLSKLFLLPWTLNLSRAAGGLDEEGNTLSALDWRPLLIVLFILLFFFAPYY